MALVDSQRVKLRRFIEEGFGDNEIDVFCFDYFYELYRDLGAGIIKSKKILLLLEYCHNRDCTQLLLDALSTERPETFRREFGNISYSRKEYINQKSRSVNAKQTGHQILYVDNDIDLCTIRCALLEHKNYIVKPAYSLSEASNALGIQDFDLIITDLRLIDDEDVNDFSGLSLAKLIAFRNIPIIICTGFPTPETLREALKPFGRGRKPSAVDFILKSEGIDSLLKSIRNVLEN